MKFLHIVLISLLLTGCTPPVEEMTPTPSLPVLYPYTYSYIWPLHSHHHLPQRRPCLMVIPSWLVQAILHIAAVRATKSQPTCSTIYRELYSPRVIMFIEMERLKSLRIAMIQPGDVTKSAPIHPQETMIIILRTQRVILIISGRGQASLGRVITVMIWEPGISLR